MSVTVMGIAEKVQAAGLMDFREELVTELNSILDYWEKYTVDKQLGGFYGSVSNDNTPDPSAPKGIVLYSRILWAFSAAYRVTGKEEHLAMATRAFDYILVHFIDHQYGGVYWSLDASGQILEGRKQIYGLAFCIYGLSEYYGASNDNAALHHARLLF